MAVTTLRSSSAVPLGIIIGILCLVLATVPVGSALVQGLWAAAWLSGGALAIVRVARMGVDASPAGVRLRQFLRDMSIDWGDIESFDVVKSDNVSGRVAMIAINRSDGSTLNVRSLSSYSRDLVENWRDTLTGIRPDAP